MRLRDYSLFFLVGSMALVVSCKGQPKEDVVFNPSRTDPELQKYVDTFKVKMALAGVIKSMKGVNAVFSEKIPPGTLATCTPDTGTIKISPSVWAILTEPGREQLMYHELGHCVLNRTHTSEDITRPSSIMHSVHFSDTLYETYYGEYMAELFSSDAQELSDLQFNGSEYASSILTEEDFPAQANFASPNPD